MDEIFNKGKIATNYTFSSKCMNTAKSSTSTTKVYLKSSISTVVPSETKSSCSKDSSISKLIP